MQWGGHTGCCPQECTQRGWVWAGGVCGEWRANSADSHTHGLPPASAGVQGYGDCGWLIGPFNHHHCTSYVAVKTRSSIMAVCRECGHAAIRGQARGGVARAIKRSWKWPVAGLWPSVLHAFQTRRGVAGVERRFVTGWDALAASSPRYPGGTLRRRCHARLRAAVPADGGPCNNQRFPADTARPDGPGRSTPGLATARATPACDALENMLRSVCSAPPPSPAAGAGVGIGAGAAGSGDSDATAAPGAAASLSSPCNSHQVLPEHPAGLWAFSQWRGSYGGPGKA